MRRDPRNAHHLATISYDGRFWDAYLELQDTQTPESPVRGRIAFSAADESAPDPIHTTTIFIENTPQDVLTRARDFKTHQLLALLRSAIPTEEETPAASPGPEPDPQNAETDPSAGGAGSDRSEERREDERRD